MRSSYRNRELRAKNPIPSKEPRALAIPLSLSPREENVLYLLGKGMVNKEVAHNLGVNVKRIEANITAILKKTDSTSAEGALKIAIDSRALDINRLSEGMDLSLYSTFLTFDEQETLKALVRTTTHDRNKKMTTGLKISGKGVEERLSNIYKKLGLQNRKQAIVYYKAYQATLPEPEKIVKPKTTREKQEVFRPIRATKRYARKTTEIKGETIEKEDLSAVGQYSGDVRQFPLLSFEQQTLLFKYLEEGKTVSDVMDDPNFTSSIPLNQQEKFNSLFSQSKSIKDIIFYTNTRLVFYVVKDFPLNKEDLIQEGNLGLLRAIELFDYKRGNRFSTYATGWIKARVISEVHKHSPTLLKGRDQMLVRSVIEKVQKGEISETEIGDFLKQKRVARTRLQILTDAVKGKTVGQVTSLDKPLSVGSDETLGRFLPTKDNIEETVIESDIEDKLKAVMKQVLRPKELAVLMLRMGFEDGDQHTLEDIGSMMGITRERVRQIESIALKKLLTNSEVKDLAKSSGFPVDENFVFEGPKKSERNPTLTRRQIRMLKLFSEGATFSEIGNVFRLKEEYISRYFDVIKQRLNCSFEEIVIKSQELGLV